MSRRFRVEAVLGSRGGGVDLRATRVELDGTESEVLVHLAPEADGRALRALGAALSAVRHHAVLHAEPATALVGGGWALICEPVDAVSASALRAAGPVPVRVALAVVAEVASAIDAARAAADRHPPLSLAGADLSPGGVWITARGQVKLVDLGLPSPGLPPEGAAVAPERLRDVAVPESAVYALGALLYELIVGSPLPSSAADRHAHERRVIAPIRALGDGEARRIVELVERMAGYDPTDRPTLAEIEHRCTVWAAELPGLALPEFAPVGVAQAAAHRLVPPPGFGLPTPGEELVETTASGGGRPLPSQAHPPSRRRPREPELEDALTEEILREDGAPVRALAGFAAVALLIAAGLALFLWQHYGGSP